MYTQSNYNGAIVNTLNGTVNFPGVCNASSLTVQQPIVSNITSVPTLNTQIGYSQTVVATGRVAIAQNTWTNVNSLSVTLVNLGVYIVVGTIPVVLSEIGGALSATQIIYSLSTSSNANDYYNQCCEVYTGATIEYQQSLQTTRILTCTYANTPVYLIASYQGTWQPFTSSAYPCIITYTRIA